MGSDEDKKDIQESIRTLIQTTEELKAIFPGLAKDQKEVLELFLSQAEATGNLAQSLLANKKGFGKRFDELESCRDEQTEKIADHETRMVQMEERIKKLEFKGIKEINAKLERKELPTSQDLETVNDLIINYPDEENLCFVKCGILEAMGKKAELLAYTQKITEIQPNSAFAWYLRGSFTRNKLEKIEYYEKSLGLLGQTESDNRHTVLHDYANALFRLKRLEPALENITKALEIDPKCSSAWNVKGMVLLELKKIPESLGCMETGLKLDANSSSLWMSKGKALAALGSDHSEEALACFDTSIEKDPKFLPAYASKAQFLLELGKPEESLKTLDAALKIDQNDPCIWYDRGRIYLKLGKPTESIEDIRNAIRVAGGLDGCPGGAMFLAGLYSKHGSKDDVLRFCEEVMGNQQFWNAIAPDNKAEIANNLAWSIFKPYVHNQHTDCL